MRFERDTYLALLEAALNEAAVPKPSASEREIYTIV